MSVLTILFVSVLILLCVPPWKPEVSAQSGNPAVDLVDHYGKVAPYFILLFYRYFNGNAAYLSQHLMMLKDTGRLRSYCQYLQVPNQTCKQLRPGTTLHATFIISALNEACCGQPAITTTTTVSPATTTTLSTTTTTPTTTTTTPTTTTTTPTTTTTTPTTTTTTPTTTTTTPTTTTTTPTTTTTTPTTTTTTPTTTTTTPTTTTTTPTTTTTTPTTTTTTPTTTSPTTTTTTTTPATPQACGPVKVTARIFGGVNADRGEFPWIAQLLFNGDAQCACVLIDEYNCITAGHCVDYTSLNRGEVRVAAGKWQRALGTEESEQIRTVVRAKRHEFYEDRLLKNDIALMRVDIPFNFTDFVYPVCLPGPADVLPDFCEVAGFGSLTFSTTVVPDFLQKVSLRAYTKAECLNTFQSTTSYDINTYLHDGVMCAANGVMGGKDSCRGDSGSSLMCLNADGTKYTVFGIVSSGFGCGDIGQPGYYTYIPDYTAWIENAIVELGTA